MTFILFFSTFHLESQRDKLVNNMFGFSNNGINFESEYLKK